MVKSRRAASSICGPQTLSRSTRPLASTTCVLSASSALAVFSLPAHLVGGGGVEVGAEGRDLDHLVLAAAAEDHVHEAEAPADDEGAAEQRLDLLGRGVGGDVEVLRAAGPPAGRAPRRRRCRPRGRPPSACAPRAPRCRRAASGRCRARPAAPRRACPAGSRARAAAPAVVGALAEQALDELLDHSKSFRMGQPRSRAMRSSAGPGLVATGCADALEQRQVVGGIAVEGAALEVAAAPARARPATARTRAILPSRNDGTPRMRAGDAAGRVALQFGGDQRRRRRTASAIGRVTKSLVAVTMASRSPASLVALHQRQRRRVQHRAHHLVA